MSDTKKPDLFQIYGVDPKGLNVLTATGPVWNPLTAKSVVLYPGDVLEVTPETVEANRDRAGFSFLELTEEEQHARYGRLRFGVGPVPQHVTDALQAQRVERLEQERASLIQQNPHLRRNTAASLRLQKIDAAIAGAA